MQNLRLNCHNGNNNNERTNYKLFSIVTFFWITLYIGRKYYTSYRMCSLLAQNTYYAYSIAVIFHNLDLKKKELNFCKRGVHIFLTNQDCNILEMNSNTIFETGTISILVVNNAKHTT